MNTWRIVNEENEQNHPFPWQWTLNIVFWKTNQMMTPCIDAVQIRSCDHTVNVFQTNDVMILYFVVI